MEAMLLGNPMSAARAYEIGYINRVVADGTHIRVALDHQGSRGMPSRNRTPWTTSAFFIQRA